MTKTQFHADRQLAGMLKKPDLWRTGKGCKPSVDLGALVVDFIGRTESSLFDVLAIDRDIYQELFEPEPSEFARALVLSQVPTAEAARDLDAQCKGRFEAVRAILADAVSPRRARTGSSPGQSRERLEEFVGHEIRSAIWQLSDLHFGGFNQQCNDPSLLATVLQDAAQRNPAVWPDLVVISGDLTSVASADEFGQATEFCRALSLKLWQAQKPDRILVVPGNHDVRYLADGSTDRMREFQDTFCQAGVATTPFGPERESLETSRVERWGRGDDGPPAALVSFEESNLEFLLLVSSYWSGQVPLNLRELVQGASNEDALLHILRVDEGSIDFDYVASLNRLGEPGLLRVGLIHHHPIPYEKIVCPNPHAELLLRRLEEKGVKALLHGHVHFSETGVHQREPVTGQSYPIPCPTLSGYPTTPSTNGFNVVLVGEQGGVERLTVLLWTPSGSYEFSETGLSIAYQLDLASSGTRVSQSTPVLGADD